MAARKLPSGISPLEIVRDLMLGGRHSRQTVGRHVSLPTADRWLKEIATTIPGVRLIREGKTSWYEWKYAPPRRMRVAP